jgi:hypothetical protein
MCLPDLTVNTKVFTKLGLIMVGDSFKTFANVKSSNIMVKKLSMHNTEDIHFSIAIAIDY